jgi:hypothetical protein
MGANLSQLLQGADPADVIPPDISYMLIQNGIVVITRNGVTYNVPYDEFRRSFHAFSGLDLPQQFLFRRNPLRPQPPVNNGVIFPNPIVDALQSVIADQQAQDGIVPPVDINNNPTDPADGGGPDGVPAVPVQPDTAVIPDPPDGSGPDSAIEEPDTTDTGVARMPKRSRENSVNDHKDDDNDEDCDPVVIDQDYADWLIQTYGVDLQDPDFIPDVRLAMARSGLQACPPRRGSDSANRGSAADDDDRKPAAVDDDRKPAATKRRKSVTTIVEDGVRITVTGSHDDDTSPTGRSTGNTGSVSFDPDALTNIVKPLDAATLLIAGTVVQRLVGNTHSGKRGMGYINCRSVLEDSLRRIMSRLHFDPRHPSVRAVINSSIEQAMGSDEIQRAVGNHAPNVCEDSRILLKAVIDEMVKTLRKYETLPDEDRVVNGEMQRGREHHLMLALMRVLENEGHRSAIWPITTHAGTLAWLISMLNVFALKPQVTNTTRATTTHQTAIEGASLADIIHLIDRARVFGRSTRDNGGYAQFATRMDRLTSEWLDYRGQLFGMAGPRLGETWSHGRHWLQVFFRKLIELMQRP